MQRLEGESSYQPPLEREFEGKEFTSRFHRLDFAAYWPGAAVTNDMLEARTHGVMKPNGKPLRARGIGAQTGVERRYIADPSLSSLDLARTAIRNLDSQGEDAQWLIVPFSHPLGINHAQTLQREMFLHLSKELAFDVNVACSGGPYALTLMKDNEELFLGKTGILAFGETYQRYVEDMKNGIIHDPSMAQTLFTDGGFAMEGTYGKDFTVMHYKNKHFPELASKICMPVFRSRMVEPVHAPIDIPNHESGKFTQDGHAVLDAVENHIAPLVAPTIEEVGFTAKDIKEICIHQGSKPVFDSFVKGLPDEYQGLVYPDYADGNFSSGSTFKGLMKAISQGRVQPGDTVVLAGFGAGVFASIVILKLGYKPDA